MKDIEVDLDQPLHFDDTIPHPIRIRDAVLVDGHVCDDPGDSVTAFAHHQHVAEKRFGEFGPTGGQKAEAYSRSVMSYLHHEREYCPCRIMSAQEYKECKCDN